MNTLQWAQVPNFDHPVWENVGEEVIVITLVESDTHSTLVLIPKGVVVTYVPGSPSHHLHVIGVGGSTRSYEITDAQYKDYLAFVMTLDEEEDLVRRELLPT